MTTPIKYIVAITAAAGLSIGAAACSSDDGGIDDTPTETDAPEVPADDGEG